MLAASRRPAGDFRQTYASDMTLFDTNGSFWRVIVFIGLLALFPIVAPLIDVALGQAGATAGLMNNLVTIGIFAIAALGLNILVGFTGQISLGQGAFFALGALVFAWLCRGATLPFTDETVSLPPIPPLLALPLTGLIGAAVGALFGLPALRIKGIYLVIATLAAAVILGDFLKRASWLVDEETAGTMPEVTLFGIEFINNTPAFLYVVLIVAILCYVGMANLIRTRDGRALVAVRDHYLSAEMMGINLARYRILGFAIAAFFGALAGSLDIFYNGRFDLERVDKFATILLSIEFLSMIIIGGLGSIQGSLMGAVFITMLPFAASWLVGLVFSLVAAVIEIFGYTMTTNLASAEAYIRGMAIGLAIILFLIFQPDGINHLWKRIKAYIKLYPFAH